MDFDDLLRRYFGTSDISELTPTVQAAGAERMQVDLGLERDPGKRFALWSLLYLLGAAPDLEAVFEDHAHREAARNFIDLMGAADEDAGQQR